MEELLSKLLNINRLKFLNTSNRIKQSIINYVYYIIEFIVNYCEYLITSDFDSIDDKIDDKIDDRSRYDAYLNNTIYICIGAVDENYIYKDKPFIVRRYGYKQNGMYYTIADTYPGYYKNVNKIVDGNNNIIEITDLTTNFINEPDRIRCNKLFETFKRGNVILRVKIDDNNCAIVRPYKITRAAANKEWYALFKIDNTIYKIQEPKLK